ncbi:protein of unknown function [Methylacidimicrobium sp. AP8]|nr:protein of unknown function [Methylacidimicrobium sp. AP8]
MVFHPRSMSSYSSGGKPAPASHPSPFAALGYEICEKWPLSGRERACPKGGLRAEESASRPEVA